ncbi:extracellular solute-binding protein [Cohnella zeiphila]|uniref:Extracellular solute-binding protein n=1 Tax=Cohnella zeiphila TaxID=2761120 RepID=A0A7X0SUX2_9BACL|nr:extracellular solute-binding protein [Cohnella zeiphila]MBB6734313.1 extracellular solute-binding protein [Cohnella zeiphila]
MSKAKVKVLFFLFTAIALVLSACSGGNGNQEASPSGAASSAASSAGAPDSVSDSSGKRLALNWFLMAPANAVLPDGETDFITSTIEKKFNVDLNIQYLPGGTDYDNKLNLLIASGDTPDLFITTGTASQKMIMDGITADMTPYVTPEKMPNYFKWVSETELQRYAVENKFERAPVIFPRKVYRSYYIRKDWLDKLGLQMPTNYDGMMDAMRAFTKNDPDGNGKNDTYGFGTVGSGTTISLDFPQWIQNGLIGSFMIKDNQFVDVQTAPEVQQVLQGVKDTIKEGVVDPDWFLMKGNEAVDKAASGKLGIVVGGTKNFAFDSNPTSLQNASKAINPQADWEPFHPFAQTGAWTENLPDTAFLLSRDTAEKDPEKIERIVQILNWIASEEGFLLINYGQEGKHYTRSGSTITVSQANVDALQKDNIEKGNFMGVYQQSFYTGSQEADVLGLTVVDESMTDRDRAIADTIASYKLIPSIGTNVAPPTGFNLADYRKKMREYHVKIVFDEPDASNWPKYRDDLLKNYGGQQMIDTYTEQIKAAGVIK